MDDLIRAYMLVIERALDVTPDIEPKYESGTDSLASTQSPYSKYFIATSEQMKWGDIFALIAEALYEKGKLASAELRETPADELGFIGMYVWCFPNSFLCVSVLTQELCPCFRACVLWVKSRKAGDGRASGTIGGNGVEARGTGFRVYGFGRCRECFEGA